MQVMIYGYLPPKDFPLENKSSQESPDENTNDYVSVVVHSEPVGSRIQSSITAGGRMYDEVQRGAEADHSQHDNVSHCELNHV